jgi:membrane associated rhomboid family serine protease
MPLSDRDYMRRTPSSGRYHRGRGYQGFVINPVWALIIVNFLVFIATTIDSSLELQLGLAPVLFTSRPWTVLTAMFVHASIWHIVGNMITLYFFGMALYHLIGQNRFLLLYFVGGIVGNLLYVLLGAPMSIVVGASGAIFAVAGALAVIVPRLQVRVYFIIPMPLWAVVVVFFGLWSIPGFMTTGIAWQAHLGGIVTGLVAGYFFRRRRRYHVY